VVLPELRAAGTAIRAQSLVDAADALAQAESDQYDQLQAASDAAHLLMAASLYIEGGEHYAEIGQELERRFDFTEAKTVRMMVIAQIQYYARQLAALNSGIVTRITADDPNANPAHLWTMLGNPGSTHLTHQQADVIKNSVADLTSIVSSPARGTDIHSLAANAKDPLQVLVEVILEDRSINYLSVLQDDKRAALQNILHLIYNDHTVNSSERLATIMMWRSLTPSASTKADIVRDDALTLLKTNDAIISSPVIN